MEKEVLEQETEQEETEQEQEAYQPEIKMHDPNAVNVKDFKFKSKKDLKGKFRRAERILTVDDPDNPDEPIHFHLRALTPAEESSLHQKVISDEDMRSLASKMVEKTESGEKLETEDITGLIVGKINNSNSDVASERYLRKVQMGTIKPSGLTIQWFADLNPVLLELFHDTIDDLRIEQERWLVNHLFRKVEE